MVLAVQRYLIVTLLAAALLPLPLRAAHGAAPPATVALARTENEPLTDVSFLILKEAYRRLGIDAVTVTLPGERAVQVVNNGQYFGDVIHGAGLEQSYPNLLRVPVPLLDIQIVAFTSGRTLAIPDLAALKPYRVCIRRGIKLIELATAGMDNVLAVNQYGFIFNMLKIGHCDVALLPRSAWLEAQRLHIRGLHAQDTPLQIAPSYHYVYKGHADIVPALAEQLQKLRKSGYIARVDADYLARLDAATREGREP